jgi:predicted phage-related endonuclease
MPKPINISASRGAAILGLSNWKTPVQSWLEIMEGRQPGFCEKHGYVLPEFEYNSQKKWGHAFEDAIIELAENKFNLKIENREEFFVKDKFITCHIDGIIEYKPYQFILHEGKTTSWFYFKDYFGEPGTDQVPIEYQIQCQHQLICTGAEKVILSVLVFPKSVDEWEKMGWDVFKDPIDFNIEGSYILKHSKFGAHTPEFWAMIFDQTGFFHQYEINANKHLQNLMIEHYTEFWNTNVLGEKEPEAKSYDDIKALCPEPTGTIIADETIERLYNEYKNIKLEISDTSPLAKRADQIKVDLLNYMRKNEKFVDDDSKNKYILRDRAGKKLATYGKNKKGQFIFR